MKEVSALNINKLIFRNFKTLEDVSFEPGRVNVFIGANGSGKTTILEAIGLLCAAMTDRVDNASMQRKGVRLSVPGLYKSAFSDLKEKHRPLILMFLGVKMKRTINMQLI